MKSVVSLMWGVFLALGVGLLTIFGIIWPLFMTFFDTELAWSRVLAAVVLVLAIAFSFYWGGMGSSYRAPSRRRLHGTLVAPVAFMISPVLNFSTGQGFFPGLNSIWTVGGVVGVLVLSTVAAYIGARRGESLYAHNRKYIQRRNRKKPERDRERRQRQEEG
ncbi:MAG: hypothetical protein WA990_15335 [Rubrobacteraceae bacterium]